MERDWQRLATAPTPEACVGLRLAVLGREGEPLTLTVLEAVGRSDQPRLAGAALRVCSASPLQRATGQPLDHDRLVAQLGR
ncbi:MAG: hypothetical protein ACK56F_32865, partial [bacterium]